MLHRMRVRSRENTNRASRWPIADLPDIEQQMDLYLTVMNRISSNLGLVLWEGPYPIAGLTTAAAAGTTPEDGTIISTDIPRPRHWNVDILRGMRFPPHLVPKPEGYEGPIPIIELVPLQGISAPGHICIHLQGLPSSNKKGDTLRRKKRAPLSLVFDACFRN